MASKMRGIVALVCGLLVSLPGDVQYCAGWLKHNHPRPSGNFTDFEKAPCREVIILKPWAVFIESLTRARGRITNLPANLAPSTMH